ncbi:hypothetical protein N7450_003038 [Penicillium hetheringtonii]|uniref:DUF7703 domain-containing protein n=1 Tax=Penicillium hetheringtonii TaxID=911720 RepID=A0AAD6DX14_9EURO|nr:hypothetical protein N7450_003038 [Penicillium hetheringtonii]
MSSASENGIIGEYSGNDFVVKATFTVFLGIALYNSIELMVLIFASFRRYQGLYFWSLLLATVLGVIPQSISFILKYYNIGPLWFSITLSTIGWYFMVTGQALVLFSRLNIVVQDLTISHRVLAMIIVNAIILHVPTTILTYGSNFVRTQHSPHLTPSVHGHNPNRKIMYQLLAINALIIVMDIVLLVFEYLNYFVIQTTLKSAVYSIKLKLEFGVLSRLVFLVQSHQYWPRESPRVYASSRPAPIRDNLEYHTFLDDSRDSPEYVSSPKSCELAISHHIP